jgi:uncharacterized OsmC-like protein/alpha-beta hydrolase superfamily lysophospholipase
MSAEPSPSDARTGTHSPERGSPRGWALLAHGFPATHAEQAGALVHALTREGIGVRVLDLSSLGSDPDGPGDPLEAAVTATLEAARQMERAGTVAGVLVGHGIGGAAALASAARLPHIAAVATIYAPTDDAQRVRRAARALGRPLLVLHGTGDPSVPIDHAARIYRAARDPRSFISLDRADRLLSDAASARSAGAVVAAWFAGYLAAPEEPRVATAPAVAHGSEVVVRTGRERFRTEIRAGAHTLLSDEPAALGGADSGPDPYGLLLAALGACTSITLRMYADRKGWPLEEVIVRLSQARDHAGDSVECPGRPTRTQRVTRTIELVGPLDSAQRLRLLEIADRCPVHRTLDAGVLTDTVLLPAAQTSMQGVS